MGIFDGIGNAPMPNSGLYFKDGTYLVEIMACRTGESRKPGAGAYCAVEATVLEVLVDYEGGNVVGERVNWVVMMRWAETALSNLKGFICAAVSADEGEEIDPDIITPEMAEMVFGGEGDDFTKVVWYAPFQDVEKDKDAA